MKIVELTVSKSQKVGNETNPRIPQFETKDYFISMKAELDCQDKGRVDSRVNELFDRCEQYLRIEISSDKEKLV